MTSFNTQEGKDIGYRLQFETDDKEKFLYMQEQARKCIDNVFQYNTVKHGHWEKTLHRWEFRCSYCWHRIKVRKTECENLPNYCERCGAKMDEEVEE